MKSGPASPARPDWAPTACGRLRLKMRLGAWYRADELERIGGRRFPARLHEIARGDDDGPALAYDCRASNADSDVYEYRLREYRPDEERPKARRARTHQRIAELANEGFNAGDAVKAMAAEVGGKGGGKANMAQGGGMNPSKIPQAFEALLIEVALIHGRSSS